MVLLLASTLALAQAPDPWVERSFLIAASEKDFAAAVAKGAQLAEATGILFDLRGVGYDRSQRDHNGGLTLARAACEDNGWDYPCYVPRGRWDSGAYITVEYSSAFEGFTPGLYVVIAASGDAATAKASLPAVRAAVPDAYVKTSKVYMGCMH